MTNAVSKADLSWWRSPRHPRPHDADETATGILRSELSRAIDGDTALARAARHVVWALGWRARREDGQIHVAVRYVADGAGVSVWTASAACRLVADVLCADRSRRGWWTLCPEAVAACWSLTDATVEALPAPAVGAGDRIPTGPTLTLDLPPDRSGKARCPCGGHRNGDAHPSLLFNRGTGLATCMTTGSVLRLDGNGGAQIVRYGWDGKSGVPSLRLVDLTKSTRGGGYPGPSAPGGVYPEPRGDVVSASLVGRKRGPFVVTSLRRNPQGGGPRTVSRILRGSDRAFGGPRSKAKAEAAAVAVQAFGAQEGPMILPDRFWSIDRFFVEYREINGTRGRFRVPDRFDLSGTNLSLLDLDGLDSAETDPDPALAARIRRTVRRVSGGRLSVEAIVATSRQGMQVAVKWWRSWVDASALYRDPGCRRTLEAVAAAVLRLLGRGGYADPCAWTGGRYGRRPGWRVGKDGRAVRARLWWARA